MNTEPTFYQKLLPFTDFAQLVDDGNFVDVPENWSIVISDVRGSTQAIRAGRYKEVNTVGAASIACVLNTLGNQEFPFVFGGDGSTLLIGDDDLPMVRDELLKLKALALREFQMELRVGIVSVAAVKRLGAKVKVGKYQLSPGNCTAQFVGDGLSLAEEMIKKGKPAGAQMVEINGSEPPPQLTGLSCRINPMKAKHGRILSILVKPRQANDNQALREILEKFREIFNGDFLSVSPVRLEGLAWKWPPASIKMEVATQSGGKPRALQWIVTAVRTLVAQYSLGKNIPIGAFNPKKYKAELITNSDFKKFDETLRMVVDCSAAQEAAIEALLKDLKTAGKITYGIHKSDEALMTCLVQSAVDNQHIHFIDGNDGGYALAAVQLKAAAK